MLVIKINGVEFELVPVANVNGTLMEYTATNSKKGVHGFMLKIIEKGVK